MLEFARQKGWQAQQISEHLRSGYRFSGSLGQTNWTMETMAKSNGTDAGPGSSNISHTTRWWTDQSPLKTGAFILGPKPSAMISGSFLSKDNPMLGAMLRLMLGADAPWVSEMEPVELLDEELREIYIGLSDQPVILESILSHEIKNALVSLTPNMRPLIIIKKDVVEMRLNTAELKDLVELEKFANLGKMIAEVNFDLPL